ncbi:MAG: hypothetical protein EP318_20530 [Rhodobacteraceae bacterium]|nr:MAG: hypothetical protein EP318_20530 [Paracoccaceae bacterium]
MSPRSPRWHITRDAAGLTLSRHATPRFDVAAEAGFPPLRMLPLAQMIRQDMWRALQRLRGFAPVVQVSKTAQGLRVKAGGAIAGAVPRAHAEAQIRALLDNETHRARWLRSARLT